jgi:hypothetical protein
MGPSANRGSRRGVRPDDKEERTRNIRRPGSPPPCQSTLPPLDGLSPAQVVQVLRDDQARRWRRGERLPAEAYLGAHPAVAPGGPGEFELVCGELALREELGERPTLDEYLRRFPAHADRLRRVYALHQ